MRVILRSQLRASFAPLPRQPGPRAVGDERRAWIEALFSEHLPRARSERERAIDALAGDRGVWAMLHQARHSMVETTATIERLARSAIGHDEPLQAA